MLGLKGFLADGVFDRHRPDVRAAMARVELAARQVKLEQAKRVVDVSIGVGWQHVFPVSDDQGLPAANLIGVSLTIPLPFSRIFYKGELEAAEATKRQAESQLQAVRAKAESELRQGPKGWRASMLLRSA